MRKIRHSQLRLISFISILWVLPISAFAKFNVTLDDTVTSEAPVVSANERLNVLSGTNAKAEYRITISWNGTETVSDMTIVSGTYRFGEQESQAFSTIETSENGISIPLTFDLTEEGEYSFDYSLQMEYKLTIEKEGKEPEINTINETFEGASTKIIQVWPKPIISASTTDFDAMLPGEKVEFEVTSLGGVNDSWKFEWTAGTPKGTPATKCEYTATDPKNISNGFEQQQITVKYSNTAPDKKTVWHKGSITFKVDVYQNPIVEQVSSPEGAYASEKLKYEVIPSGGNPTAWEYTWSVGQSKSNSSEVIASNINDTPIGQDVKVTVINTSPDGKVWYDNEFIWPLTIYPAPQVISPEMLPKNIFSGYTIPIELIIKGGQANAWTYKWFVDNEIQQSTNNIFNFEAKNENEGPIAKTIKATVTNNAAGVANPYTETLEYEFIIWPGNKMVTFSGQPIRIGTSHRNGWTYSWEKNGNTIVNEESTYTTTVENDNTDDSYITDTYTLFESNKNGESNEYEYIIEIYPKPSIELIHEEFNFYYGETANFVKAKGGYPAGWEFKYDGSSDNIIVADGDDNGYQKTVEVTISNNYSNLKWFSDTINIEYNAWSKGDINGKLNRVEYNGYTDIELIATPVGGYPNGWSYSWTKNGNKVDNAVTNKLMVNDSNPEAEVNRHTYILTAKNSIDGRITGIEKEVEFTFNVWPIIQLPTESEIQVSATKIRQGNNLILQIPVATGGYEYKWNYQWALNDEIIGENNEISLTPGIETSNTMGRKVYDYTLRITNPGPTGDAPWADVTYQVPEVIVYRRPYTPTTLRRKGNGTSCVMIVQLNGYNDVQLSQYKYRFVFGYTDKNGVDYFMPETENRFYQFEPNIFNNSNNTFWVLSQWNYDDGSKVTSGKRFLNGTKDDSFDASQYDTVNSGGGSRGDEESAINEVDGSNYVRIVDNGFVASILTPQKAVMDVHSIDGVNVIHQVYPTNTYFNESINTQALAPGMYIIKVYIGDMVDVKKVVIK